MELSEWLRGIEPAVDVKLPDDAEAAKMLEFCGVSEQDRDDMLAARPDPSRDADWWTVLRAMAGDVDRGMDQPIEASGFKAWPVVTGSPVVSESQSPVESGASVVSEPSVASDSPVVSGPPVVPESSVGLFVAAWALLSRLPRLLDVHARRGVPESISRASVSALGGVMGTHRDVTGRAGVGLFPLWGPPLRFRGADIEIGRHSFTRARLAFGDGNSGYGLMIHVPPIGPLEPIASEESIAVAEQFFAQHYPEEPMTLFSCTSWLLDPQLAEYLHPESNILRFQRRFTLLPELAPDDPHEGDREMMRLGLHVTPPGTSLEAEDLARIPQYTTLQRAFVTHLRSGRHWAKRTGIRLSTGTL